MREFPDPSPAPSYSRTVYTVSKLSRTLRDLLEKKFSEIWVEGEISNLSKPPSGHIYFSLKDENAQIRCALFRNRRQIITTNLSEGDQVLVRARATLYEARGDTQLVVQYLELAGEGMLRRAFEMLKEKLNQEGLFDTAHKKTLPFLPKRVGIITSPTGAAIKDITSTFKRRFEAIPLIIYPVTVQGDKSESEITNAIKLANTQRYCDVLIVARGGGSLEDLQAFNGEKVARAIFDSEIPIVSGVGHETDINICDFVADQRAATPTAAAELISPNMQDWLTWLSEIQNRMFRLYTTSLEQSAQRVDWLSRMIVHPKHKLEAKYQRLNNINDLLNHSLHGALQRKSLQLEAIPSRLLAYSPKHKIDIFNHRLTALYQGLVQYIHGQTVKPTQNLKHYMSKIDSLNPMRVLARGYAVVNERGSTSIIKEVSQTHLGQELDIRLTDGYLFCEVKNKSNKP